MVAALLTAVTGVGPGHSLENKMTLCSTYLAASDIVSACSMLDDFKNQVSALSGDPSGAAGRPIDGGCERDQGGYSVPMSDMSN